MRRKTHTHARLTDRRALNLAAMHSSLTRLPRSAAIPACRSSAFADGTNARRNARSAQHYAVSSSLPLTKERVHFGERVAHKLGLGLRAERVVYVAPSILRMMCAQLPLVYPNARSRIVHPIMYP